MITLQKLKSVVRYEPETGIFRNQARRGHLAPDAICGSPNGLGYIVVTIGRKHFLAHRLAWFYTYGTWPPEQIDHINLIRSDNRLENLRLASQRENQQNKPRYKNNTSGVKGVSWHRKNRNWRARIKVGEKYLHIGSFASKEEAAAAYAAAAERYFGQFARAA